MDSIHDGRRHLSTWKILVIASIEEVTERPTQTCWNSKTIMAKLSEMSILFHLAPGELLIYCLKLSVYSLSLLLQSLCCDT